MTPYDSTIKVINSLGVGLKDDNTSADNARRTDQRQKFIGAISFIPHLEAVDGDHVKLAAAIGHAATRLSIPLSQEGLGKKLSGVGGTKMEAYKAVKSALTHLRTLAETATHVEAAGIGVQSQSEDGDGGHAGHHHIDQGNGVDHSSAAA